MRFNSKIVEKICEELQQTPNIRYVCNKIGLDHSTFYRWMAKHSTFRKLVSVSLEMGRDRVSDAAEAVIIAGIQKNDHKSAAYWLSHNSPRYASKEQLQYLARTNENLINTVKEPIDTKSSDAIFEALFDLYYSMEEIKGESTAREKIKPFIRLTCDGDEKLEEIFYLAYRDWKDEKDEFERKKEAANPDKINN